MHASCASLGGTTLADEKANVGTGGDLTSSVGGNGSPMTGGGHRRQVLEAARTTRTSTEGGQGKMHGSCGIMRVKTTTGEGEDDRRRAKSEGIVCRCSHVAIGRVLVT